MDKSTFLLNLCNVLSTLFFPARLQLSCHYRVLQLELSLVVHDNQACNRCLMSCQATRYTHSITSRLHNLCLQTKWLDMCFHVRLSLLECILD
jgi:hypothetical protein